ncbi:MAG: hypothetical protein JXR55_02315, partial [Candidatus Fermentibacteraceae bacterium]|nr:hypothetical protein [Candidatus Fermentibacteraceae bacterium]
MRMLPLLLLTVCFAVSAEWVEFGVEGADHATFTVVESTPQGMVIDVTVPGIQLTPVTEGGVDFTRLNVPGATMSALDAGCPQLPKLSFLAALPSNPSITMEVEYSREVEVGILTPYPMQPIQP